MMKVSLEFLERCSAQTGFQAFLLEKVVMLGNMAGDIARHPFLGRVLALKVGTALNLCFGAPNRLSVDLDYNYMAHSDREKMLEDRADVEQALEKLAGRKGYRVQKSRDAFAGRKFYLSYKSVLGTEDRIELDLNFLFRVPIAGIEKRNLWQPGELNRHEIRTVSLQEIVIGKMLATLDRGSCRDFWDMANLPSSANEVKKLPSFRAWFIALSAVLNHPLPTYTFSRLNSLINERSVKEQLSPMLALNSPPSADYLVKKAWEVLSDFMILSSNETEFIDSIERGELRPDLLFLDDPQVAKSISEHPAILWKIANVRSHLHKKGESG